MRVRPYSVLALALWLVFAVGIGIGLYVEIGTAGAADLPADLPFYFSFGSFATVGFVVASRRPGNPIGWIFLAIGVLTGIAGFSQAILDLTAYHPGPPPALTVLAAWVQLWFEYPLFVLPVFFPLLLFPSGLPSRRWRPVLWVSIAALAVITGTAAFSSTLEIGGRRIPNPLGIHPLTASELEQTGWFGVPLLILFAVAFSAVISLIVRFRRSRGDERQQLKWFTYAASLVGLHLLVATVYPPYDDTPAGTLAFGILILALPLSVGIAILRYRLYAIDLLINRTLVYGSLTLLLAAVYFVGVAILQASFRALTGQDSPLAVVLSTLAIAAGFTPLRRRLQSFIDRRFYRRRYDAARALASFSGTVRDEVELEGVSRALLTVVEETVQPLRTSIWIREIRPGG